MKKLLLSLLAIILIIEEWLWDGLSSLGHWLAYHLGLARFELWLAQTTPYQALMAISIPILLVTPLNIAAFWLLANGLILQGIGLEIIAKLLGTLFVARFFTLTKPQLLTFRLIASVYNTVTYWLRWAHEKIIETAVYQYAKTIKIRAKVTLAAWFKKS
ncbi:MAG: hypothetical protein Q8N30_16695 [Methylococcales bacterium]|nr:hypothetical protein [Methylococcales bacterium]